MVIVSRSLPRLVRPHPATAVVQASNMRRQDTASLPDTASNPTSETALTGRAGHRNGDADPSRNDAGRN